MGAEHLRTTKDCAMGMMGPEAVTRLWDAHSAALVLYARGWCAAPEDVVQEAFLLLVRQSVAPENPVAWLYRVVRNRGLNASRTAARQSRREARRAREQEPWFEPANGEGIDAAAATAALGRLAPDEREAIVARLWGGLSYEEIGRLSGTSASTAFRAYQRGLAALRERLRVPCPN